MQQINYFPDFKCLRIVSSYHVRSLVSLVLFVLLHAGILCYSLPGRTLTLENRKENIFKQKIVIFPPGSSGRRHRELRFNRNLGQSLGQTNQTSSSSSSSIIYNNDDNNKKSLLTFCFAFWRTAAFV